MERAGGGGGAVKGGASHAPTAPARRRARGAGAERPRGAVPPVGATTARGGVAGGSAGVPPHLPPDASTAGRHDRLGHRGRGGTRRCYHRHPRCRTHARGRQASVCLPSSTLLLTPSPPPVLPPRSCRHRRHRQPRPRSRRCRRRHRHHHHGRDASCTQRENSGGGGKTGEEQREQSARAGHRHRVHGTTATQPRALPSA